MEKNYEAIVIGSGFGGAITGCRLAKKWDQGRVLILLERGKRYPMGSFPEETARFRTQFLGAPRGASAAPAPCPEVHRTRTGRSNGCEVYARESDAPKTNPQHH
jgi:choline dehydrogenase-like flavoprotein